MDTYQRIDILQETSWLQLSSLLETSSQFALWRLRSSVYHSLTVKIVHITLKNKTKTLPTLNREYQNIPHKQKIFERD